MGERTDMIKKKGEKMDDAAHDVWLPRQRLVPEGSLLWWVIEWVGWVGLVEGASAHCGSSSPLNWVLKWGAVV